MRLLIIGNLGGQISTASKIARDRGAKVTHVPDIRSAMATLRSSQSAELIMIDVTHDVKELVQSLEAEHISIPVIGCGFHNNADDAVKAIRAGAQEYLPFPPDEDLIAAVLEAITEEAETIICRSDAMKNVLKLAKQTAPSDANILITGESGTGKEVLSRFIHMHSRRKANDMISLNCAAIPENLLESELFGHEKGAFTGAVGRRIGKFEEADNSTLLLDEISEIDIKLQAKLLRAIQEKEIERIGGSKPIKLNIRIIATSNRNLQDEVRDGNFRNDLYYRLNIINLHLPPLRERKQDIPVFVDHFIEKYSKCNDLPVKPMTEAALEKLNNYAWPGNVRELENTLHRAVLLSTGNAIDTDAIILTEDGNIPLTSIHIAQEGSKLPANTNTLVGRTMESVERDLILGTLDHCLGNRTRAAHVLGISIRTLRNKLKTYQESGSAIPANEKLSANSYSPLR